jgi:uncharacterized membrane protein
VGLLIAMGVFFMVQGLMMDLVFLALVACIALGSLIDARRKRRERRGEVAQALDAAEAILKRR